MTNRLVFLLTTIVFSLTVGLTAGANTSVDAACMTEAAGFDLTCTANDVQISGIAKDGQGNDLIEITDPCEFPNDTTTFTATFDLVVTSKERFDVGLYFATDGDQEGDGALSGRCSVSTIDSSAGASFVDLDEGSQPDDDCGDINKTSNPLNPTVTINAVCVDSDGDGFLNLPNCTSWRQSGANDLCTSPADAFPGSPSKCRCDLGFGVPVPVPPAVLKVVKTAIPTSISEPGDFVTFSVSVTNVGIDPVNGVELTSLTDDIYGNITTSGHDGITETTCTSGVIIPSDDGNVGGIDTYECAFTATVTGDGGESETDTVTAVGMDDRGNELTGTDSATVDILDVLPSMTVTKTANPTSVSEAGGNVTFTVTLRNNSESTDPLTVTTLTDDIANAGAVSILSSCLDSTAQSLSGQTINPAGTLTCTFITFVSGGPGAITDVVTGMAMDDEGNTVSASDDATVTITNIPSNIDVMKTANPSSVDEPGGLVTFTVHVKNLSEMDSVTIDTLSDDKFGDLGSLGGSTCSVPFDLESNDHAVGGLDEYTCTFTEMLTGQPGVPHVNEVTASGLDDDGEAVSDSDGATVTFNNIMPTASVAKDATSAVVTYTLVVTNTSDAESLTLTSLVDDRFGDITTTGGAVSRTDCSLGGGILLLSNDGDATDMDTYTCTFDAHVDCSPHVNTVTATVDDDDGSASTPVSDDATVTLDGASAGICDITP